MRKSFVIKALPLLLIMLSLSFIQTSDGFLSQSTAGWKYQLSPGESQVFTWTLTNTQDDPINIEFRAEGNGSELFVFEELVTMESKENRSFEFIVIVPEDHPNNIEYRPMLFALEKAIPDSSGGAAVLINYEMSAKPIIKIGDNPIFTPEIIPEVKEEPKAESSVKPSNEDFQVTPEETIEEKLARIQATNQAKEIKVDDIFEESFEEEAVLEYEPEPEYVLEPEVKQVPLPIEDKVECDFFAMFLSWFGIGNC